MNNTKYFLCILFFLSTDLISLKAQDDDIFILKLIQKRNEINDNTKETIEKTIEYLSELDIYPQSIAKVEIKNIIDDYKNICHIYYSSANLISLPGAKELNETIIYKSKEILKSKKFIFFAEMKQRKLEMDKILNSLKLNEKQLEKVKESYNNYLSYPLEEDNEGNFIGFNFNPQIITEYGPKTGTGFLISKDGIIVTNNHVVKNADKILIKCIIDNSVITYNATLLIADSKNDLALLKISDYEFELKSDLPFIIKDEIAEVGEEIFVLGYPLTSTMGEEIKVTTGIISSRTGFQGDVTCYQVSAPVQPGNSGGPLLNNHGDIIGIITAKHNATENVTYAVKSSYLKFLILMNNVEQEIKIPTKNTYSKKSLVDKIKILRDLIFIIETE